MSEEQFLAKLGQKIQDIRQQKGMSQTDVSALTDIETNTLSKLESGKTNPRVFTLFKLADALKVNINELLDINSN